MHPFPFSLKKYVQKKTKMKFKYKALIGTVGVTIFVLSVQIGMQFIQSYRFVGFVKRDESSWIGIAEVASADKQSCMEELKTMKDARDAMNQDILGK